MKRTFSTVFMSFGLFLFGASLISLANVSTSYAAVDDTPDCDNVAIIRCGVSSPRDMRQKAAQGDVPKVFNAMNISQGDLKGGYENGVVWRDGRVTVDGKVVATGAMTAGRNFGGTAINGTKNAGTYSTSKFVTEGQTAYVKMIDGKFSFAVIKSCGNPVSATPKTPEKPKPAPTYECVGLSHEKISRTKHRFTTQSAASGGAKVTSYEYNFGDNTSRSTSYRSASHTYDQPGTYTVSVKLHVKVNDTTESVTSSDCKVSIIVAEAPKKEEEPCVYDESLPADSPDCREPVTPAKVEKCDIKGKENVSKDSDECVEEKGNEPETPKAIADTGIGGIASGVIGSGALGYGAYAYAGSRRHLLGTFLKRNK